MILLAEPLLSSYRSLLFFSTQSTLNIIRTDLLLCSSSRSLMTNAMCALLLPLLVLLFCTQVGALSPYDVFGLLFRQTGTFSFNSTVRERGARSCARGRLSRCACGAPRSCSWRRACARARPHLCVCMEGTRSAGAAQHGGRSVCECARRLGGLTASLSRRSMSINNSPSMRPWFRAAKRPYTSTSRRNCCKSSVVLLFFCVCGRDTPLARNGGVCLFCFFSCAGPTIRRLCSVRLTPRCGSRTSRCCASRTFSSNNRSRRRNRR